MGWRASDPQPGNEPDPGGCLPELIAGLPWREARLRDYVRVNSTAKRSSSWDSCPETFT